MEHYEMWLQADRFDIVAFYPYTSIIMNALIEQSYNYKTPQHEFLEEFGAKIKEMAIAKGARWDNKVVVEIRYKCPNPNGEFVMSNLFVGFKDGIIRIGIGVWMPDKHFGTYKVTRYDEPEEVRQDRLFCETYKGIMLSAR